jgi:hypothetical protein
MILKHRGHRAKSMKFKHVALPLFLVIYAMRYALGDFVNGGM